MEELSDQHLAHIVFLHKHMGFSSQVIRVGTTDKPITDD